MVVDLMVEMLRVVEEEYAKTEDEVVQLHEEEVAAMLKQFKMDYNVLEGDRNIWRTVAFIEGGALVAVIVYAILK